MGECGEEIDIPSSLQKHRGSSLEGVCLLKGGKRERGRGKE